MLKKILLALMFVVTAITNVTHAEDDMKTVASKAYVDTKIETKQLKIPAANTPGVGAGETVMTYTSTGNGEIGERGLYSDISSYDATTDGDKLITASALNATFTNLPTTPTTKLECANQADGCTLWTIVDQTAYGKSRNLLDLNRGAATVSGLNVSTNNQTLIVTGTQNQAFANISLTSDGTAANIAQILTNSSGVKKYDAGKTYTIQFSDYLDIYDMRLVKYDKSAQQTVTLTNGVATFTPSYDICDIWIRISGSGEVRNISTTVMLEEGASASPYEPY